VRDPSKVGSGFGKRVANWVGRDKVYPTNVLYMATETSNTGHSAAFPKSLPEWFIELFTQPGDWVLDPFMGSGTTLQVAQEMSRNAIGIDIVEEYCESVREELLSTPRQYMMFEEREDYEASKSE
jgi:DNA modification methylase